MSGETLGIWLREKFGRDVFDDDSEDDPIEAAKFLLADVTKNEKRVGELEAECNDRLAAHRELEKVCIGLQAQLKTEKNERAEEKSDYKKGRRDVLSDLIEELTRLTCDAWLKGKDEEARIWRHRINMLKGMRNNITVPSEEEDAA